MVGQPHQVQGRISARHVRSLCARTHVVCACLLPHLIARAARSSRLRDAEQIMLTRVSASVASPLDERVLFSHYVNVHIASRAFACTHTGKRKRAHTQTCTHASAHTHKQARAHAHAGGARMSLSRAARTAPQLLRAACVPSRHATKGGRQVRRPTRWSAQRV